ncbi:MAG: ABC transporter substrate-binding protein [Candidatus Geothermarchaeales archaeon]
MDPAKAYDFFSWEVMWNYMEGLLKYKPGTTLLEPGLAESYTVSPDGLAYTLKIREGLSFTDGTPLDASVVKYSLERVINLNLDPSWLVSEFVDKVDVVDTYTVKITLKDPVSFFPQLMASVPYFPVSPKAYPADKAVDSTVGIGPLKITNWIRDVEVDFEANPDYYGAPSKSKNVVIKFFGDATTMRLALQKGSIDVGWRTFRPIDISDFQADPNLNVIAVPGPYIRYIVINTQFAPPLDNKAVRQALAYATDRKAIADEVFMGTVTPLYSMIPGGMWSHEDVFKDVYGETPNYAKTRELLATIGYNEGNKLPLELWYTPTHYGDTEADVATVIKASWEASGVISVTVKSAEWSTYLDYMRMVVGVAPIMLFGWYPDYLDPDDYTTPFLDSAVEYRLGSYYSDPEMDELLEAARTTINIEERTKLYKQVQDKLAEDVPHIPIFQGTLYAVTQKNVKGVVLDPAMIFRYFLVYKE